MWKCDYCTSVEGFSQLSEFTKHLKLKHLQKQAIKKGIIYRCSYGHNGLCEFATFDSPCEFQSEKQFEIHLVKRHIKQIEYKENDPFKITDIEALISSRNYLEVTNSSAAIKKWTPYHSKINLPAILNDPQNRQLDIFSRTWGEAFEKSEPTLTVHLVAPSKSVFVDYIMKVRSSQKYREKMMKKVEEDAEATKPSDSNPFLSQKADLENVPKIFFQTDFNLNRADMFSSVIPILPGSGGRYSPPNGASAAFTLLDNTLHHQLTKSQAHLSIVTAKSHRRQRWLTDDDSVNRINEKLSSSLDIVEIHIAKQVSKKSNSFFEAVSTQDKVRDKLMLALTQIANVRQKLTQADTELTKNNFEVLMLAQRKKNLQILLNQLRIVKLVHSAQSTIQTLLSTNDLCGALDLIADTERIMLSLPQSMGDGTPATGSGMYSIVHRLNCLRHVAPQLHEMRTFLHKMVRQEYVNAISSQLRIEDDWQSLVDPHHIEVDYQMVPSLLAMIRIVVHTHSVQRHSQVNLAEFMQLYFDDAIEQSKTIVKSRVLQAYYRTASTNGSSNATVVNQKTSGGLTHSTSTASCDRAVISGDTSDMTASVTSEDSTAVSTLADQMRTLDFEQWMALMQTVLADMIQLLERVIIGCHTMRETLLTQSIGENDINSDSSSQLPQSLVTETRSQLATLPSTIAEAIVQRCVKLVRARAKNGFLEKLSATQLLQVDRLMAGFVRQLAEMIYSSNESDDGSGAATVIDPVTACMQEHATRLANRFHNEHREKLLLLLDTDLWRPADTPSHLQEMARHISSKSGVCCPDKNGLKPSSNCIPCDYSEIDKAESGCLVLDGCRFSVAAAALILFQMLVEYCQCAQQLTHISHPHTTTQSQQQASPHELVLGQLCQLLDSFNSRCCQLVLGAKARRNLDLETISARNLAVAARSLELVLAMLPRLRAHFQGIGPLRPASLISLENVRIAITDHVEQVVRKLVELLEERASAKLLTWCARPPSPSAEMRGVCQQLGKLHDAVCGVFSADAEVALFRRVHTSIKAVLRSRVQALQIAPDDGPQHGIIAAELGFYMSQLNCVCGLRSFGDKFLELWR